MSWAQGTAFLNASERLQSKTDPNAIQLLVTPFNSANEDIPKSTLGIDRTKHDMHSAGSIPPYVMVIAPTVLQPKSTGYVELRTNDPRDHPVIDPRYLSHDDDLALLLEAWNYVHHKLLKTEAMSQIIKQSVVDDSIAKNGITAESQEYAVAKIKRDVISVYHASCTCKMGPDSDSMAVLDPSTLKVKTFVNLRVVDCSSFPDIPAANTNLAAIMIGERAADLIFKESV